MKYLFVGTQHSGIKHLALALGTDEMSDCMVAIQDSFVVHVVKHPVRVVNLLLQDDRFRYREPQNNWEKTIYPKCNLHGHLTQEERAWAYYLEWNKSLTGMFRHLLWRVEDDPRLLCLRLGLPPDLIPAQQLTGSMKDATSMSPIKRQTIQFVREYKYYCGIHYML